MAGYVDGFVLPIPKKKVDAYRRLARKASKVWMDHGALEYVECIGDDLQGLKASFPKQMRCKPDETVVFAWVRYKSKAHRDRVNAKVMKDPRIAAMMGPESAPFDMRRMLYGGFKTLVEA